MFIKPKNRKRFFTSLILSALFQLVFTAFVAFVNQEALTSYLLLSILPFLFAITLNYVIIDREGNIVGFIVGQLLCFGLAVQSTIEKPDLSTFIIYSMAIASGIAVIVLNDKLKEFMFGVHHKLCNRAVIIITALMVLLIIFVGFGPDNTRSWVSIFGFSFQVTDILRLSFCWILAKYCIELDKETNIFTVTNKGATKLFLLLALFAIVFLLSNELGTLLIIMVTAYACLFLFYNNRKMFKLITLAVALIGILGLLTVYVIVENDIEVNNKIISKLVSRFGTFIAFQAMDSDSVYQIERAQEAISLGGLLGTNSNHNNIVNNATDMVFVYIVNKLGSVPALIITASYIIFFVKVQQKSHKVEEPLYCLLNIILLTQSMLNIMSSINLLPLTGVPLCFLSSGGTNLILNLIISTFLIMSTCRKQKAKKSRGEYIADLKTEEYTKEVLQNVE